MKPNADQATLEQLQRAYELQKKAREEADHLLEEKSRELYFKNESLREALDKLSQQQAQLVTQEKLASVGQLGASLAHELNNPNAFIQNNLVTLEDYIQKLSHGLDATLAIAKDLAAQLPASSDTAETLARLADIKTEAEIDYIKEDLPALMRESLQGTKRITSIANGLRYFANPDVSTRKSLDVNQCIRHAQALVHNKDKLAHIDFELDDIPSTQGMPLLLSQAIANLIQNAIEAQKNQPKVHIRSYQNGEFIYIDIEDQGPGIDAATLKHLFEPFYTTKTGQNGLGLGITQHIVQQHDGSIQIGSDCHQGTRVVIKLPIIVSPPSEA